MAHGELFLLRVILIRSRLFAIPISKFHSKNRLELEEQKRPTENINLNLDSPVPPEIKKSWVLPTSKERRQILSRNYFLIKRTEKGENILLRG